MINPIFETSPSPILVTETVAGSAISSGNGLPMIDAYLPPAVTVWTSASAVNSSTAVSTLGMDTVVFTYVPTGTVSSGVITFEVYDGATWVPMRVARSSQYATELTYSLSGGQQNWQIGVAGYQQFRARLSTVVGGSGAAIMTTIVSSTPDVPNTSVGIDVAGASGTTAFCNVAVTNTVVYAKTSSANLYGITVTNPGTFAYLQLFNAASGATLGSTAPFFCVGVPASGTVIIPKTAVPTAYTNGIGLAATATASGSGAPGTAFVVSLDYV